VERAILRLAAYELAVRLERPAKVVIDESVKLALEFGATDSHQFINAVLHKLALNLRAAEMSAS
jgi:N utilization substance protein B